MPWHIEADNADCQGFAVVKDANGEIEGCHRTRTQAERQLAALYAAEPNLEDRAETYAPTDEMVAEAERGLAWRAEHNRGGTEVGVARARDIANRRNLPLDTVNRMVSYFARHEVDKQGQGWSPGQDGYPSAGRIAWALWGGDPGRAWANNIARENRAGAGPAAIVTDIDGTLVTSAGANQRLIDSLNGYAGDVIVLTARNQDRRPETEALLQRIGLRYQRLVMSPGGDAVAYKRDAMIRLLENHTIGIAYENNPDVRAEFEDLGIDARAPFANRQAAEAILASFTQVR